MTLDEQEDSYRWTSVVTLGIGTYVLGGALLFYGRGTILLLLVLFGYLNRVIGFGRGERGPPAFDDWVALLYDGTRLLLVWLFYFLALPLLALVLDKRGINLEDVVSEFLPVVGTATISILRSVASGDLAVRGESGTIVSTVQVGSYSYDLASTGPIVVFFVLVYVYPAALIRFWEEDSFWAAFDGRAIGRILKRPSYVGRWTGFAVLSGLAVYTLILAGSSSVRVADLVWRWSGNSFFLSNEAGELVVFAASMVSFQLLVLSHFVLGYDRRPAQLTWLVEFVERYETAFYRVLLGGILLSFGIFPTLVFVVGFVSLVLARSMVGHDELPSFSAWREIGLRGVSGLLLWLGCLSVPVSVLVLGQRASSFPGDPPPAATAVSNALIGATSLPIGPPISFQFDRLVGDALWMVNVQPLRVPYVVADPRAIRPEVLVAFIGAMLLVWFLFPLLLVAVELRRRAEHVPVDVVHFLGRLVRDPGYLRAWTRATVGWTVGGLPLVGWYVWRRYIATTAPATSTTPPTLAVEPLGVALPTPSQLSLVSILFLSSASVVCFYSTVTGYRLVGRAVNERLVLEGWSVEVVPDAAG